MHFYQKIPYRCKIKNLGYLGFSGAFRLKFKKFTCILKETEKFAL